MNDVNTNNGHTVLFCNVSDSSGLNFALLLFRIFEKYLGILDYFASYHVTFRHVMLDLNINTLLFPHIKQIHNKPLHYIQLYYVIQYALKDVLHPYSYFLGNYMYILLESFVCFNRMLFLSAREQHLVWIWCVCVFYNTCVCRDKLVGRSIFEAFDC